jgi:hypothetical protein
MVCADIEKCYAGGEVSPITCQLLTVWIHSESVEDPS